MTILTGNYSSSAYSQNSITLPSHGDGNWDVPMSGAFQFLLDTCYILKGKISGTTPATHQWYPYNSDVLNGTFTITTTNIQYNNHSIFKLNPTQAPFLTYKFVTVNLPSISSIPWPNQAKTITIINVCGGAITINTASPSEKIYGHGASPSTSYTLNNNMSTTLVMDNDGDLEPVGWMFIN